MRSNIRLVGFELYARDGQVFSSEAEMISVAKGMMISDGKVYSNGGIQRAAISGGKFARKAARRQAARERRAAAEVGITL